jgi:hypothetical protein
MESRDGGTMAGSDDFKVEAHEEANILLSEHGVGFEGVERDLVRALLACMYGRGWIAGASETKQNMDEILEATRAALLEGLSEGR